MAEDLQELKEFVRYGEGRGGRPKWTRDTITADYLAECFLRYREAIASTEPEPKFTHSLASLRDRAGELRRQKLRRTKRQPPAAGAAAGDLDEPAAAGDGLGETHEPGPKYESLLATLGFALRAEARAPVDRALRSLRTNFSPEEAEMLWNGIRHHAKRVPPEVGSPDQRFSVSALGMGWVDILAESPENFELIRADLEVLPLEMFRAVLLEVLEEESVTVTP